MTGSDAETALPRAAVVVFPGSNGDRDLAEALASAGFAVALHPSDEPLPPGVRLVGLPGGFSYGDYWRAGVLAAQARAVRSLPAVVAGGGLVLGICNGFQTLVAAGLLPGALAHNAPPGFRHRWVTLTVSPAAGRSPWFAGIAPGTRLRMPMAHGEGRFVLLPEHAAAPPRIPLTYDENPNGSSADAAAVLDETGQILGIMPHPERACDAVLGSEDGDVLFSAARRALRPGGHP